ncbi:MAG: glycosyltransferase family 4 protein [Ferrimicrobium sp.]
MTRLDRIVLVGTELAALEPKAGGLERLVCGWASELLSRGIDCILISLVPLSADPILPTIVVEQGQLADALASEHSDCIVINNRPNWTNLSNSPTILVLHNIENAWGESSEPTNRSSWIVPPRCEVAAVSRYLADRASAILSHPVSVLAPFADPAFFTTATQSQQQRSDSLLFPNRLLAKKGVEELLAALPLCNSPDLSLGFIMNLAPWSAPTPRHLHLIDRITSTEGCRLIPRIDDTAELAHTYRSSRGVVCPSTQPEGFGLVPLEALASGAPTLVAPAGGMLELAEVGAAVAEPTDPHELATALDALWNNPIKPDQAAIEARFSRASSADRLEQIINHARSTSPRPRP